MNIYADYWDLKDLKTTGHHLHGQIIEELLNFIEKDFDITIEIRYPEAPTEFVGKFTTRELFINWLTKEDLL